MADKEVKLVARDGLALSHLLHILIHPTILQVLRSVKSQANGHFTISAPGGEYILSITDIPTMNGVEFTEPVRILDSRTVTRTYAVSAPVQQGQLRIVLTWGATPRDMDSHLDTPSGCHLYYGRKQCPSGEASLDTDVTDSYGPETINIRSLNPGVYKCATRYHCRQCHVLY